MVSLNIAHTLTHVHTVNSEGLVVPSVLLLTLLLSMPKVLFFPNQSSQI